MKNQYRQPRDRYNQDRNFSRRDQGSSQRTSDWYDRDPMDERSGYRDEERDYSQRMDSNDVRGYNDHYRYDQMYHNYYGSADYNPDRERGYDTESRRRQGPSSYDSDRYSRGQGAYGTSSSGRASWDTGVNSDANRWSNNDDYNRDRYQSQNRGYSSQSGNSTQNYGSSDRYHSQNRTDNNWRNDTDRNQDRTSSNTSYGATQGSWAPNEESRSSFYGRGPKNFKRSDERIKEEICEMLTRNSAIDADDIEVEVKEGEVILSGNVTERRMKHLAEDVAEQCFGVKDVVNNIRVKRAQESDYSSSSDRSSTSSNRDASSSTTGKKSSSSSSGTNPNPNH